MVNPIKNLLFLTCFSIAYTCWGNTNLKNREQECNSAFGTILGTNSNTIGYSNCNNDNESDLWNIININASNTIQTGMKWQCVEYARRWLITQKGYTFASIDHAYQIWDLLEANNIMTGAAISWEKFPNAKTKSKPQRGDLLIYDRTQGVHGHVSVIVDVNNDDVFIAEQNYSNLPWEGDVYARKLLVIKDKNGFYTLQDSGVIGWMHINT